MTQFKQDQYFICLFSHCQTKFFGCVTDRNFTANTELVRFLLVFIERKVKYDDELVSPRFYLR